MKKILITGATGMLGAAVIERWRNTFDIRATASTFYPVIDKDTFLEFDLVRDDYDTLIHWAMPDVVVHCAAMTHVDDCERQSEKCIAINAESVKKFLRHAPHTRMIYISSDAVFPIGTHLAREDTSTSAINIYGRSKELGEHYINESSGDHTIIRTTIVGTNVNPARESFAEWIIKSVKSNSPTRLFNDVLFTPISIWDLAQALEWVIENQSPKVLHIAGGEVVSKYDFGYNLCKELHLDTNCIQSARLSEISLHAQRKVDQSLDSTLFASLSGYHLPTMLETIAQIAHNISL